MGILGDYAEMDRIRQRRESINDLRRDGFLVIKAPVPIGPDAPTTPDGMAELLSEVSARIADQKPLSSRQALVVLNLLDSVMQQLTPPTQYRAAGVGSLM